MSDYETVDLRGVWQPIEFELTPGVAGNGVPLVHLVAELGRQVHDGADVEHWQIAMVLEDDECRELLLLLANAWRQARLSAAEAKAVQG